MQYLVMDSITDDLLPLYKKMANYDFAKPIHITVSCEETDNFINYKPFRNNKQPTKENQQFNTVRNDQTKTNYTAENARTQSHGINITNHGNINGDIIVIPKAAKNTTVTNNLYMNDQTPSWISEVLFEKDQQSSTNSCYGKVSTTSNNPSMNFHKDGKTEKSLYVVSKYLIELLKTHNYFEGIIKSNKTNCSQKNYAKINIQEASKYYGSLCFDIVSHVILPQKYNNKFITDFLLKTKQMIYTEGLNFTDKDINRVYSILIKWTERRIMDNNIRTRKKNNMPKSVLREHTFDDQSYNSIKRHQNSAGGGLSQDEQTRIFSHGSTGNKISVNFNTEILHDLNSQNEQSTINNFQNNEVNETVTRNGHNVDVNTRTQGVLPIRSTSRDSGFVSPCRNQIRDQSIEEQIMLHSASPCTMNQDVTYLLKKPRYMLNTCYTNMRNVTSIPNAAPCVGLFIGDVSEPTDK